MSLRGLTVTAGAALGLAGLLALTLFGGLERATAPPSLGPEGDRHRVGPLTAVQPDLRRALLSEADLPAPEATIRADAQAPADTPAPPAPGPTRPAVDTWPPGPVEACRSLVEDPATVAALWPATPPQESTSGRTHRPEGATIHQVLAVFQEQEAPAAFGRLRETAAGCGEFPATLDGEPVTVVLRQLEPPGDPSWEEPPGGPGWEEAAYLPPSPSPSRATTPPALASPAIPSPTGTPPPRSAPPRSAPPGSPPVSPPPVSPAPGSPPPVSPAPTLSPGGGPEEAGLVAADEAFELELTVYGSAGTLTGWVALDRVGPAVSVLRRLGPQECSAQETIETRRAALIKLRQLLESRG